MNYSHTRISTFENCPLQYKYRYIERPTVTLGVTIEVFMGRRVHETLEDLYRDLGMTRLPELEALLDYYRAGWEKHWDENIRVIRKEYTPDDYREKGRRCIEDYYRRYYPFDQGRTIGIEERVRVPLGSDRVLTGFIDRLDRVGEGIYEIHDYKTSSHLPTQEEIDRDRQLALYQMDIQNRWRDVKEVILVWHYLVFDRELRSTRTPRDQEELLAEINKVIDQIEAATEYEPRESSLCDWCDFQNICPLFKHLYHVEELSPRQFKEDDGVKLADRYAALLDEEHSLKVKKERLKRDLIDFCLFSGYEVIYGTDRKIKLKKTRGFHFPGAKDKRRKELEELLRQTGLWDELSSLNLKKLEKVLRRGTLPDELREQLKPFYSEEESFRLYGCTTRIYPQG